MINMVEQGMSRSRKWAAVVVRLGMQMLSSYRSMPGLCVKEKDKNKYQSFHWIEKKNGGFTDDGKGGKEVNWGHEPQKRRFSHGAVGVEQWLEAIEGEEGFFHSSTPTSLEEKHLPLIMWPPEKQLERRHQPAKADSTSLRESWVVSVHLNVPKRN